MIANPLHDLHWLRYVTYRVSACVCVLCYLMNMITHQLMGNHMIMT